MYQIFYVSLEEELGFCFIAELLFKISLLKKKVFIYLGLSCRTQDLHCIMWDLLFQLTDFLVVGCGLQSIGSVAAAQGLSCSEAGGILVFQPEIETASPAMQGRLPTTGMPEKSLSLLF